MKKTYFDDLRTIRAGLAYDATEDDRNDAIEAFGHLVECLGAKEEVEA